MIFCNSVHHMVKLLRYLFIPATGNQASLKGYSPLNFTSMSFSNINSLQKAFSLCSVHVNKCYISETH